MADIRLNLLALFQYRIDGYRKPIIESLMSSFEPPRLKLWRCGTDTHLSSRERVCDCYIALRLLVCRVAHGHPTTQRADTLKAVKYDQRSRNHESSLK
jgi:hypothetical protein